MGYGSDFIFFNAETNLFFKVEVTLSSSQKKSIATMLLLFIWKQNLKIFAPLPNLTLIFFSVSRRTEKPVTFTHNHESLESLWGTNYKLLLWTSPKLHVRNPSIFLSLTFPEIRRTVSSKSDLTLNLDSSANNGTRTCDSVSFSWKTNNFSAFSPCFEINAYFEWNFVHVLQNFESVRFSLRNEVWGLIRVFWESKTRSSAFFSSNLDSTNNYEKCV